MSIGYQITMEHPDLDALRFCAAALDAGQAVMLVTVVSTWGSSPRPEGSVMAIRADGAVTGSVSGGCIEDDLVHQVLEHGIRWQQPELVTYGISADEAHRFGLPCGGTLQLLLEPLHAASEIHTLLALTNQQKLVARTVDLQSGQVTLRDAVAGEKLVMDQQCLTTIWGPGWRLLIIGAGTMSRFLATVATGMGYQVFVCDPREEYRHQWDLPQVQLLTGMPDDEVLALQPDQRTAIVALTHDPKLDDLALMEALQSPAFYVGAIGSRKNNQKRRERLVEFGVTAEQLARLFGPVGMYIGSKTPPEIAISILAEMTAVKNGVVESVQWNTGAHKAQTQSKL